MASSASDIVQQVSNDPAQWLKTHGKGAVNKVGYLVLDWLQKTVGSGGDTPGGKKQEVAPKQFFAAIKDGSLLCNLANKLKPGAVANVHSAVEGQELDKEKQGENLDNFIQFAKQDAGVQENAVFAKEDVQDAAPAKGMSAVLPTLLSLGVNAKEKFGVDGINTDAITRIVTEAGGKNFIQNLINRFFKKGNTAASQSTPAPVEAANTEETPAAPVASAQ